MSEHPAERQLPSPDLIVSLRHTEPVAEVPEELLAFVTPVEHGGELFDWQLTADALAFGDVAVPQMFDLWRSSWVREWTIDPLASLHRLVGIASDFHRTLDHEVFTDFAEDLAAVTDHGTATLDVARQSVLADALEALRDVVRGRESTGYGFVNASPGFDGTGLARAWSPSGGSEVLAANPHITVLMDPQTGLGVDVAATLESIRGINTVDVAADHVVLRHIGRGGKQLTTRLRADHSRPLAWAIPTAVKWRVVKVPEVLVWARTFANLVEGCRFAADLALPVTITTKAAVVHDVSHSV